LFERVGTNWFLRQTIARGGFGDEFGYSVAISGDKIVVGMPKSDASVSVPLSGSTKNLVPTATDQGGAYFFVNSLVPTAANVTVGGRVLKSDGRGLANTTILLTDSSGNSKTVRTSSFGNFRFDEIEPGEIYIISINSKKYRYSPRVITLTESVTDLVFTPE
jgi:hypothetical protein